MASTVLSLYDHCTENSAPRADLCISGDGGVELMPQSMILSALKASEVRKADPILWRLRTLSSYGAFIQVDVLIQAWTPQFAVQQFPKHVLNFICKNINFDPDFASFR